MYTLQNQLPSSKRRDGAFTRYVARYGRLLDAFWNLQVPSSTVSGDDTRCWKWKHGIPPPQGIGRLYELRLYLSSSTRIYSRPRLSPRISLSTTVKRPHRVTMEFTHLAFACYPPRQDQVRIESRQNYKCSRCSPRKPP